MIGQITGVILVVIGAAFCTEADKRVATSYSQYHRQYEQGSNSAKDSPGVSLSRAITSEHGSSHSSSPNHNSNLHYKGPPQYSKDSPAPITFSGPAEKKISYPVKVPLASIPVERPYLFQAPKPPYPIGLVSSANIQYPVDRAIPYPFKFLQHVPLHQPVLLAAKLPYLYQPSYHHQDGSPHHYQDYNQHFR